MSLLDRLRNKHTVNLGMELEGYTAKFLLEGTEDLKILVSSNEEFYGSAQTIDEAIDIIARFERKEPIDYNRNDIQTTYVAEEDYVDTKMYEEIMPKKLTKSNKIEMHGKKFYIVKKKPNGSSSGKMFCLYNFETRNLIWVNHDRDILIGFLATRYREIEHKDV